MDRCLFRYRSHAGKNGISRLFSDYFDVYRRGISRCNMWNNFIPLCLEKVKQFLNGWIPISLKNMAWNGALMGVSLLLMASIDSFLFFINLSANEVSMIRIILLIPLFYGFIRVIQEVLR